MFEQKNTESKLVWVEDYRPHTLDDCILPERILGQFRKMVEDNNIQSYSAIGTQGCGKTSSIRAMCDQLNIDYIIINMSAENGIDVVRNKILNFASSVSFTSDYKVIILDECLSEEEAVRIGTVDNWKGIKLKDLEWNVDYPIVSFNMETQTFENDVGRLISDKEDDLYEVTLEDGSVVILNSKHPFIVKTSDGRIIEKTIEDGLDVDDLIVKMK